MPVARQDLPTRPKACVVRSPVIGTDITPVTLGMTGQEGTLANRLSISESHDLYQLRSFGGAAPRAYLVLGGDGWTLRDYHTSGGLTDHIIHAALVRVVTLERCVRLANDSEL